jgi:bacteriocin-like protein
MEVVMTRAQQQIRETETRELSETELDEVTGGIIAVLQQKLCDGSVRPAAPSQNALIGLL